MRKSSSCASRLLSSVRGSALSELMIVTPFVVMVTFGTLDLNAALKQHSAMVEAARVAARAAAILPPNTDEGTIIGAVEGAVVESLTYESSGISAQDVALRIDAPRIESSMLSPIISLSSSLILSHNLSSPWRSSASSGTGTATSAASAVPNVRYIRVRLSARRLSFSRYFSEMFAPREVVSVFPLAVGNTASR